MCEKSMRKKGPALEPKVLSEEEWERIKGHLTRRDEPTDSNETQIRDGLGKRKTSALADGVHKSLKGAHTSKTTDREEWETAEIIPKLESLRKCYQSQTKKEEIIIRAKEMLFENKDYSRRLLRGLKLSTVLHERNRQMEFNRSLKRNVMMREREMRMKLVEEAGKYEEELRSTKEKKREKMESFRKELDRQMSEKMEGWKRGEVEKAKEKSDLLKMKEELKFLAEEERLEEERKRQKLKEDIANYLRSEKEIRQRLRTEEKEQDEINRIYQVVAWKIDKIRRDKEQASFRKARKLELETIRDLKEPARSGSGDEKLKEFLAMREARKRALLEDLLAGRKMAEEETEKREAEDKLERKRCSLMRCRKEEADRARSRKEREERQRRMKSTMGHYILQWLEKEEERKTEKELEKFYAPDFTKENELIAEHCDEVLGLVKRYRRPVYPVAAAVKEIKREFGLDTEIKQNFMKSNVPIGK